MDTNNPYGLPTFKPRSRLTLAQREDAAAKIPPVYNDGLSIRDIAEITGRSYGFIHRLLTENGVELRGRGGDTRGRTSTGG